MSDKQEKAPAAKYGLAVHMPASEAFKKTARKAASSDDESLDNRRIEFEQKRLVLEELLKEMSKLSKAIQEETDEAKKLILLNKREGLYTLASYSGITGLYEGAGLIMDLVSLEMEDKNEEGKKFFFRRSMAEMLYDVATFAEEMVTHQRRTNKYLRDIGLKLDPATWKTKHGDLEAEEKEDAEEAAAAAEEGAEPVKLGLTEEEIAEKKQITPEARKKVLGES